MDLVLRENMSHRTCGSFGSGALDQAQNSWFSHRQAKNYKEADTDSPLPEEKLGLANKVICY